MSFSPRVRVVHSFEELVGTSFGDGVNALYWQRQLPGDFSEVVRAVDATDEIITLDEEDLLGLKKRLNEAGRAAVDVLVNDQRLLQARGLAPILDCIPIYPRDNSRMLSTDVYSFHVDRAPVEADTYLCTYSGLPSEGLRNEQACKHVDIPETRAKLLAEFGGVEGPGFDEFLAEHSYDLHYAMLEGAHPFSFGIHNLWRIAVAWPGCPVPPCIHRAPATQAGDPPRLLLIS